MLSSLIRRIFTMLEENSCGILIKQIHDSLEKNANNALRGKDLTMAQVGVLIELYNAPKNEMPLKDIERKLHVAQSTAAGIVARLEEKDFVVGFGSADDKRIKMVRITTAGLQCCKDAEENMKQAEEILLHGLTDVEQNILYSLLLKVSENIK